MKTILITGASGGVGRALAARLETAGCDLVLVGRDAARLADAYGNRHLQIVADCSTVAGAQSIFEKSALAGRRIDGLAHCVGNIRLGALHRMKETDFNDCLQTNLVSAFHTLGAFVAQLRADNRPGAAVMVSSAATRIGTPNHEAVAAAKAGVEGLTRAAAATYAANGIRINTVAPGIMDTPATGGMLGGTLAREAAAKQYPIPGIGTAHELAGLMAWLLSDEAARVTGQVWSLDGGFSSIRPLVK